MHRKHMWFDLSPVANRQQDAAEVKTPVLQLTHFTAQVHLDFGTVVLGRSKSLNLGVHNPHPTELSVYVVECAKNKDFSIGSQELKVEGGAREKIQLTWTPKELGNCRRTLQLKTSAGQKLQVILFGAAIKPPAKRKANPKVTLSNLTSTRHEQSSGAANTTMPSRLSSLHSRKRISGEFENQENVFDFDQESGKRKYPSAETGDSAARKFAEQDLLHPLPLTPVRRKTFRIEDEVVLPRHPLLDLPTCHDQIPTDTSNDMWRRPVCIDQLRRDGNDIVVTETHEDDRRETYCISRGFVVAETRSPVANDTSVNFVDSLSIVTPPVEFDDRFADIPMVRPATGEMPTTQTSGFFLEFDDEDFKREKILCQNLFEGENISDGAVFLLENDSLFESNQKSGHESFFNVLDSGKLVGDLEVDTSDVLSPSVTMMEFRSRMRLMEESVLNVCPNKNVEVNMNETFDKPRTPLSMILEETSSKPDSGVLHNTYTKKVASPAVSAGELEKQPAVKHFVLPADKVAGVFLPVGGAAMLEFTSIDANASECFLQSEIEWNLKTPGNLEEKRCSTGIKPKPENETSKEMTQASRKLFVSKEHIESEDSNDPTRKRTTWISISPPKVLHTKKKKPSDVPVEVAKEKLGNTSDANKKSPFKTAVSKMRKGIAKKKLTLVKSTKASMVHHPNPFTTKNKYYDELWKEKQEMAFSRWMNFVLTPPDEFNTVDANVEVNAAKLWAESIGGSGSNRAPTKEDISLQTYTAVRKMNKLRRDAGRLFESEKMASVISRLEAEIYQQRLCVREDRALHADFGIKQEILNLILSYHPLWLRLALETVFGEILPLSSNRDVVGLSTFIVQHLLHNQVIAGKYVHPSVPHLFREGFEQDLKAFILKKFLLLVLFLDTAKCEHLVDHDPCLFVKQAKIKSSKELLQTFSKNYLKGEGDIVRHLAYFGYRVSWEQKTREEFDYAVTNIAVDLRCGLRLARVIELLMHAWNLTDKLRCPVMTRLHKISNMEVVVKELKKHRFLSEGSITVRDIVDGHREKTLQLLWDVIFKTRVEEMLDRARLYNEVRFAARRMRLQSQVEAMDASDKRPSILDLYRDVQQRCIQPKNPSLALLLRWTQAVCAQYHLEVENLASSFSDGRALCYLIHHYHPDLLPREMICNETTLTRAKLQSAEELDDSLSESFAFVEEFSPSALQKMLQNEKQNLTLAFESMKSLGGIPTLTSPKFMSNTIPDEKVVITLLSYLQMRLLSLSEEIRSARIIQLAWRNKRLRLKLQLMEREEKAARTLQVHIRAFLQRRQVARRESAAVKIQCVWRGWKSRRLLHRLRLDALLALHHRMAVVIQRTFRSYIFNKKVLQMNKSATIIQTCMRGYLARKKYERTRRAAVIVQRRYRSLVACRYQQMQLRLAKHSAVLIQACFRGWLARKHYLLLKGCVVQLQARCRGFLVRTKIRESERAATLIQRAFKAHREMKTRRLEFVQKRRLCIGLQRAFRTRLARKKFVQLREAVVVLQANFRGLLARRKYQRLRSASTVIREKWKATLKAREERKQFLNMRNASVVIQSHFRSWKCRRTFLDQKQAALTIQLHFRASLLGRKLHGEFLLQKASAIEIQSYFRAWKTRQRYRKIKKAAVTIQSRYRASVIAQRTRLEFVTKKTSIIVIQSHFRTWKARKTFLLQRQAAVTIQSHYRASVAVKVQRREFLLQKASAIQIQSCFRAWKAKQRFILIKKAAIAIQSHYRAAVLTQKTRHEFILKRKSAIAIQSYFRVWKTRQSYIRMKKAAVAIQSYYRATVLARRTRRDFILKKASSIIIQSHIRAWKGRRTFLRHKQAAITIQSQYRAFVAAKTQRCEFLLQKSSAIRIQSHFHAWKARQRFLHKKKAAALIQSRYRAAVLARKTRHEYVLKKESAIAIQSYFRAWRARRRYLQMKKAAVTIQSCYRAIVLGRKTRQAFALKKKSTIVIQSHIRAWRERGMFLLQKQAAITIQSHYRASIVANEQRCKFLQQKASAIQIQSFFRASKTRQRYLKIQKAVASIQSHYRAVALARKTRQEFVLKRASAIVIQSHIRAWRARRAFLLQKQAAVTIQLHYRAVILGRKLRHRFLLNRESAIQIQSYFRSWKTRQRYRQIKKAAVTIQSRYRASVISRRTRLEFVTKKTSVIVIQSHFRVWKARRTFLLQRQAVVTIQSHYRASVAAKTQRCDFLLQRASAIQIQSCFRAWKAKQRFNLIRKAAVIIQSHYRAAVLAQKTRREFILKKESAIKIQSYFHAWKTRQSYIRMKKAAVAIQSHYRATVLARRTRQDFILKKASSIIIQSHIRAWKGRRTFLRHKQAAITIQSHYRAFVAAKTQRCEFLLQKSSAIRIQSQFHAWKARQRFLHKKKAAALIQSRYRAAVLARKTRQEFILKRESAVAIQSYFRTWRARRSYLRMKKAAVIIQSHYCATVLARRTRQDFILKKASTILIQSHFRAWKARRTFLLQKQAAITIQSQYRASIAAKVQRCEFLLQKASAVQIQSCFRAWKARQRFLIRKAAVTIQFHYRAAVLAQKTRHEFVLKKESAIAIQSYFRARKARQRYRQMKKAAITIQSWYRAIVLGRRTRQEFVLKKASTIMIQSYFRTCKARKTFLRQKQAAITIQFHYRAFVAARAQRFEASRSAVQQKQKLQKSATIIQVAVRKWLTHRQRMSVAARTIQACWRGYKQRCAEESSQLAFIRARLSDANASASEDKTLRSKTTRAIHTLLNCKDTTRICLALLSLDRVTALDGRCCERIGESGLVNVLVKIINSCNRSLTHIEIITYALNILLNLAKYDLTISYVWKGHRLVDMVVTLMKVYSDKPGPIVLKLCTLMWVLLNSADRKKVFQSNKSWMTSLAFAHETIEKREKQIAVQQKHHAKGLNSSSRLATPQASGKTYLATPALACTVKRSPTFLPAWRLNRHCLEEFSSPLDAIQAVINALHK